MLLNTLTTKRKLIFSKSQNFNLKIFNRRVEELETYSKPLSFRCFQTSIWDETLYQVCYFIIATIFSLAIKLVQNSKAWSQIVHELILNAAQLEKSLKDFADVIEADEILLFEKTTFLVVSHCLKKEHTDLHRFEKISNIIKQFKLSCRWI